MRKGFVCLVAGLAVLLLPPPSAVAQEHGGGGGGGGGGGCGDVFGDLIHILRHPDTGQPILQKRWVELPKDVPGYGWGYCKIAVDDTVDPPRELAFAPLSCDVAEADLGAVVPVDYFGRLNGGRTKERNNRMHSNEVLSSLKEAGHVKQDPSGRLTLGYDCATNAGDQVQCAEWSTVDSPMESLGLYSRLMKYGHFQTDPWEVDPWRVGDPKQPEQYHPALGPEDYAKFHQSVRHLLPNDGADPWACFVDGGIGDGGPRPANGIWDPTEPYTDLETEEGLLPNGQYDLGEPFMDINANGIRDDGGDTFRCTDPGTDPANPRRDVVRESLDGDDFTRGAIFLGAAANKTGKSTRDLVQYINRILKITQKTPHTYPTLGTLPALVRDCPSDPEEPNPTLEPQVEPSYDMSGCTIVNAPTAADPDKIFPDLHERFVDFLRAEYRRLDWRNENVEIIQPSTPDGSSWFETTAFLMDWLAGSNGPPGTHAGIDAFVEATGDTIRSIQFIHNYAIPEPLWDFGQSEDQAVKVKTK